MQEVKEEISIELYDKYKDMEYCDRKAIIEKDIPLNWKYGYGYYGHTLTRKNDKCYIIHILGETCD